MSRHKLILSVVVGSLLVTSLCWAALTFQWKLQAGTATTLMSPNSIASDGYISMTSPASYNNTIGQTGDGYTRCIFELVLAYGSAPSANAAAYLWLRQSIDGTNFATAPSSSVNVGPPQVTFAIPAATASRLLATGWCPAGVFTATLQLAGTGQTSSGSGNTLKVYQFTPQGN